MSITVNGFSGISCSQLVNHIKPKVQPNHSAKNTEPSPASDAVVKLSKASNPDGPHSSSKTKLQSDLLFVWPDGTVPFLPGDDAAVKPNKAKDPGGPHSAPSTKIQTDLLYILPNGAQPIIYSGQDVTIVNSDAPSSTPTRDPHDPAAGPQLYFPEATPTGHFVRHYGGTDVPATHQPNPSLTDPITGQEAVESIKGEELTVKRLALSKTLANGSVGIGGRYQIF